MVAFVDRGFDSPTIPGRPCLRFVLLIPKVCTQEMQHRETRFGSAQFRPYSMLLERVATPTNVVACAQRVKPRHRRSIAVKMRGAS
jgi:hypothetical protein